MSLTMKWGANQCLDYSNNHCSLHDVWWKGSLGNEPEAKYMLHKWCRQTKKYLSRNTSFVWFGCYIITGRMLGVLDGLLSLHTGEKVFSKPFWLLTIWLSIQSSANFITLSLKQTRFQVSMSHGLLSSHHFVETLFQVSMSHGLLSSHYFCRYFISGHYITWSFVFRL
jgi:hypothetical protein